MALTDQEEEALFMLVDTLRDIAERQRRNKPQLTQFIDGQVVVCDLLLSWFARRALKHLEEVKDGVEPERLQQVGVQAGGEAAVKPERTNSSFQIMRSWKAR